MCIIMYVCVYARVLVINMTKTDRMCPEAVFHLRKVCRGIEHTNDEDVIIFAVHRTFLKLFDMIEAICRRVPGNDETSATVWLTNLVE